MEISAPVLVRHGELQVLRQLPPGFRFHPTDEELVVQYLRRKALGFTLPAAVIPDVLDLHKLDPWDIPGAREGEKYFFAVRPTGGGSWCGRSPAAAVATASGCWKPAGGREKPVVASRCGGSHLVGVKRSMVFVLRGSKSKKGSGKLAPRSSAAPPQRTDWVMHEYRLALPPHHRKNSSLMAQEWVVCRVFQRSRPPTRRLDAGRTTITAAVMPPPPPVSASASSAVSSSSCVTSSSDQEEVTSGGATAAGRKQHGSG